MSTQEVPEWLEDIFREIEEKCARYGLTLDGTVAKETILSRMIDKQKVEDVLSDIETLHWNEQVSDITYKVRQALNIGKETKE